MNSTETSNFLRPLGNDQYAVFIDGEQVATFDIRLEEGRFTYTERVYITGTDNQVIADVEINGEDSHVRLAQRLADGEFDNDFRYEITPNPEPSEPADLFFVRRIATPSQKVIESFTTDDPYRDVEAAREVQNIPMEERWDMYAERGY